MKTHLGNAADVTDLQTKPHPEIGFAHVTVANVNDSRTTTTGKPFNGTKVEFEILAHSVPGQEGKKWEEIYWLDKNGQETDNYLQAMSALCFSAGLLKRGDPDRDVQPEELENCQVIVEVEERKSDGKTYFGIKDMGRKVWPVEHPDVAAVPKNLDAIRLWNEARGVSSNGNGQAAGGNGNGHHAAATVDAGVNTNDITNDI